MPFIKRKVKRAKSFSLTRVGCLQATLGAGSDPKTPCAEYVHRLLPAAAQAAQDKKTPSSQRPPQQQSAMPADDKAAGGSIGAGGGSSRPLLHPVDCQMLNSEGAPLSSPRMPAALGTGEQMAAPLADGAGCFQSRQLHVSSYHIGTYAFKGCGALEMVCLSSEVMAAEQHVQPNKPHKGSKGALVMALSGPVVGLQDCPVVLPDVLKQFQQAWASMAAHGPQPTQPAGCEQDATIDGGDD